MNFHNNCRNYLLRNLRELNLAKRLQKEVAASSGTTLSITGTIPTVAGQERKTGHFKEKLLFPN